MKQFTQTCPMVLGGVLALMLTATALGSGERVEALVRTALDLDASMVRGGRLYSENCSGCHGKNGGGDAGRVIPTLAGQRDAYLIKQLADFSEQEREAAQMHVVVSKPALNEPQVWADLAAFLSQLAPTRRPQSGDGKGAELGAVIFQLQCVECHERDARGDDDGLIPSLRDQHYSYLVAQLRALAATHRSNVHPEFMQFIAELQDRELGALADYLSRLRTPTRNRMQFAR
jgi:cytochrome c553